MFSNISEESKPHRFLKLTIPEPSELNEFFTSIGSKMDAKMKHSSEPVLLRTCKETIFLFLITAEIFNICSNLKNSKSEGKNGIPNKFVKFFSPIILETLVVLINRCMVEGHFPKSLKLARVVPLSNPVTGKIPVIIVLFLFYHHPAKL